MIESHFHNFIKPPPPQKKIPKKINSNAFMYTHNLVDMFSDLSFGIFLDNLPMTNRCMRHDLNESMARCYLALGKTLEALDLTQNLVSTSMSNVDEFNEI